MSQPFGKIRILVCEDRSVIISLDLLGSWCLIFFIYFSFSFSFMCLIPDACYEWWTIKHSWMSVMMSFTFYESSLFHCLHVSIIIFFLSHLQVLALPLVIHICIDQKKITGNFTYFLQHTYFLVSVFFWLKNCYCVDLTGMGTSTTVKGQWGFRSADMLTFGWFPVLWDDLWFKTRLFGNKL